MNNEERKVKLYYCQCGKAVQCAGDPEFIDSDRKSKKKFSDAEKWGRKVETVTLYEYKKIPWCLGFSAPDCPNKKQ